MKPIVFLASLLVATFTLARPTFAFSLAETGAAMGTASTLNGNAAGGAKAARDTAIKGLAGVPKGMADGDGGGSGGKHSSGKSGWLAGGSGGNGKSGGWLAGGNWDSKSKAHK